MTLVAGAAEIDITPELGGGEAVPLMGYGARIGGATRVHDPVYARGLYLGDPEAARDLLIVAVDLCLMGPEQAGAIRRAIAAGTGLRTDQILVSCTHTHSAPDTGLAAVSAGGEPPAHWPAIEAGIVRAGQEAVGRAEPARAGWTRAEAAIGRNRRIADGPAQREVLILRVDGEAGGPLAVLYSHGCHGTVLGHDNLEISADWPGAAAQRIRELSGALPVFVLGSHADIDPRTRGLMDLAIPGQSLGLGFEAVRVLGHEFADAVLGALPHARLEAQLTLGCASREELLPVHLGDRPRDRAVQELQDRKAALAAELGVAPGDFPRLRDLLAVTERCARELPLAEARRLLAEARLYLRDKTAPYFVGGARERAVEVQLLRIGDAALLALPLEPTTNVGLDWRRRATARVGYAGVCGIGNGWMRYLPHPDDFAHPRAHEHYEVLMSTFSPGACARLLDAGAALLAEL